MVLDQNIVIFKILNGRSINSERRKYYYVVAGCLFCVCSTALPVLYALDVRMYVRTGWFYDHRCLLVCVFRRGSEQEANCFLVLTASIVSSTTTTPPGTATPSTPPTSQLVGGRTGRGRARAAEEEEGGRPEKRGRVPPSSHRHHSHQPDCILYHSTTWISARSERANYLWPVEKSLRS